MAPALWRHVIVTLFLVANRGVAHGYLRLPGNPSVSVGIDPLPRRGYLGTGPLESTNSASKRLAATAPVHSGEFRRRPCHATAEASLPGGTRRLVRDEVPLFDVLSPSEK